MGVGCPLWVINCWGGDFHARCSVLRENQRQTLKKREALPAKVRLRQPRYIARRNLACHLALQKWACSHFVFVYWACFHKCSWNMVLICKLLTYYHTWDFSLLDWPYLSFPASVNRLKEIYKHWQVHVLVVKWRTRNLNSLMCHYSLLSTLPLTTTTAYSYGTTILHKMR